MNNFKWSKRSLAAMHGIHPDLRLVLDRALAQTSIDFIVIEGLRSEERQRSLKEQGASRTLNSPHLTGYAVDVLPIGPNGPEFYWPLYHKLAPYILEASHELGIPVTWGGHWKSFQDGPHFELNRYKYDWSVPASNYTKAIDPKPIKVPGTETTSERTADAAKSGAGAAAPLVIVQQGLESLAPQVPGEWGTYLLVTAGILAIGVALWKYFR